MRILHSFIAITAAASFASAATITYDLTNLVTNATDSQFLNPWGIATLPTSPMWIAANGSGVVELYSATGTKQGLVVTIPGTGSVTGVAGNSSTDFNADNFLFVSQDGTVSGWRGGLGSNAETLQIANSGNVYTGLALETIGTDHYALLANFKTGNIDVVKGNVGSPSLAGQFVDPGLPSGYAPFNVQVLNGLAYVAYSKPDGTFNPTLGLGLGIVDAYNLNGTFLARVVNPGGSLNAPWGLSLAPTGFGDLAGDLLVGSFGSGTIDAYSTSGTFIETLGKTGGGVLVINGLRGIIPGNGGSGSIPSSLYVTAGPNGQSAGLLGRIDSTETSAPTGAPEPATLVMSGIGLLTVGLWRNAKRRS